MVQSGKDLAAYSTTAISFVDRHAAAFGLRNAGAELALRKTDTDRQGQTHLTYDQQYDRLKIRWPQGLASWSPARGTSVSY